MAAGSTYTPIATTTLGSAQASVSFSSISSSYTDLVLVCNFGADSASRLAYVRFNNDSGANYSNTYVTGNGSSATSARNGNTNQLYLDGASYLSTSLTGNAICQIQNYANTTTYKTMLTRYNDAGGESLASAGLWRGSTGSATQAINRVDVLISAGNFLSGSTFTLYGILAA